MGTAPSTTLGTPAQNISQNLTNNFNPTFSPTFAPINNFQAQVNPVININANTKLEDDKRIILKIMLSSATSGAMAYLLGESPAYYSALGGILTVGKLKITPNCLYIIGAGEVAALYSKKDIISTAVIVGIGCYSGDLIL